MIRFSVALVAAAAVLELVLLLSPVSWCYIIVDRRGA